MRALYAARQAALIEAARQRLAGALEVHPHEAGLHLVGRLPHGVDDRAAAARAAARGVEAPPVAAYAVGEPRQAGLLLGYAAVDEAAIRAGVDRLAAALHGGAA
jgi:GntR family transcriptional regulator/MocR family aminotransferase